MCHDMRINCLPSDLFATSVGLTSPHGPAYRLQHERGGRFKPSRRITLQKGRGSGNVTCMRMDTVEERYLLSGMLGGRITIHDIQSADSLAVQHTSCSLVTEMDAAACKNDVSDVCWYPLDTGMFVSGFSGGGHVWDTNTEQIALTFSSMNVSSVHLPPHNTASVHTLLVLAGDEVKLCDLRTGASSHTLRATMSGGRGTVRHAEQYRALACRWSPRDPHLLATAGTDHRISLWDVRSARGPLTALNSRRSRRQRGREAGAVVALRFTDDGLNVVAAHNGSSDHLANGVTVFNLMTDRNCARKNFVSVELNSSSRSCCQLCLIQNGGHLRLFAPRARDVITCDLTSLYGGADTHNQPVQDRGDEEEQCSTISTLSTGVGRPTAHFKPTVAVEYDRQRALLFSSGADGSSLVWTSDQCEEEQLTSDHRQSAPDKSDRHSLYEDQWSDDD